MKIRSYSESDEAAVAELWREVFPGSPSWNHPETDIQRKLAVQRELFLVATIDSKIVGTAMAGYDGHRGWVYYVAVSPRHRRQGIGTALMERAEEELAKLGCPKLNLQVRASNEEVVAFYRKLGYQTEERISMGKRLAETLHLPRLHVYDEFDSYMPIFDGHNDTLLRLPDHGGERSFLARGEKGHLDLPRAREAGFAGGFFAIFVPSPTVDYSVSPKPDLLIRTENGYEVKLADPIDFDYALGVVNEAIRSLFRLEEAAEGAIKVVRSVAELVDCLDRQVLAIVLHFEGAEAIDPKLHNLEEFYQLGLRSLGITWSRPNAFGWGVPFKFPASPDIGPGLTEAGKELVRACNELGILLDLSHLNERGFWDVAELSDAPLVATHSAAHALTPRTRNLTNKQLEAIGESNGVVGVTFAIHDLRPDGGLEGDAPLTDLVRHIDYIAQHIGMDHVAFGSDFDGATIPKEMGDVTGFPRLLAALRENGFDDAALRRLTHENWLRVLGDTWKDR